ncbi:AAA family ATPase [Roseateles violae]|uniref:AAA family ATPase n=1 Tax=Roseateles violae TaxID=3058042 RepID=A0ABT8DLW6_9BURK|nr:AAA family ATPase [Pelomonas sp. PFR6]MDN3918908.1 AAA family ATPase [Pelomonas sp. PFR6]
MSSPASDRAPATQGTGQRRNLTVVFADLSGSTMLAEAMEAEHYAAMLAQLRALYQSLIPKHGGMVVRIQGDGMLAIFGHPQTREDDGRRACEAALELHEAVRALRPEGGAWPRPAQALTLHSGIHAGMVLIDAGDEVRGRFELLGNTPNVAARLSEAARADEILVSEETLGLQAHFFDTSERRSLLLKGRATPLAAYALHGRSTVERRFEASQRRGLAPFVGRAAELRELQHALDEACSGRPRWVSVRANAGVGKTRLTEEFLRRVADGPACQIQRGYCENYLSAEPLQPFLQMLRALQAAQPQLPGLAAVQASRPDQRLEALLALFEALARATPLLLAIDDLQWADDASLTLLHRLRARAAEQRLPLLLLTATRPQLAGEGLGIHGDGEALQLELQPFDDAEASAAVVQLLPRTDPFVTAEVQRHAGGNALFIEELCHALAHQAQTRQAGPGQAVAQPGSAWLAALVESRMARLPLPQQTLLRSAAVIGNVIPAWLLQELAGCAADDPELLALAEQDFVFPDARPGQLRFKHGLTRDIVYAAIGLHERQQMHRRIAAALRARAVAALPGADAPADELLAYHDGAAGDWARAADHAERAGDQALAAAALDRAKTQYRAVLTALEHLPDDEAQCRRWISVAQRFGLACVFYASRDDLRLLQQAAELAHASGDAALIARAEYWIGYVAYALGDAGPGLSHVERGLGAAKLCADAALSAQLRGTLGQLHAAAGNYAPALALLDEAIAIQRLLKRPGRLPVGLAYSLACRATVLGDQGRFADAQALFEEALQDLGGSGHAVEASIQALRAAVLLWQGRWAEAQASAAEACRVGAQVRSLYTFSMGQSTGAYGRWMLNRAADALPALRDATGWLHTRGGGLFSSFSHGWMADLLAASAAPEQARGHIAAALRRGRRHDWLGGAMAYRAAARLAQPAQAQRYLSLADAVAERRGAVHERAVNALCAAELARARGLPPDEPLDRAETAFEALGMAWHLARARALRQAA